MIEIKKRTDFIQIYMNNAGSRPRRFPNQMIWDINTYLSNHYTLYEYYFAKAAAEDNCIVLSKFKLFPGYICFCELHPSYIKHYDYNKDEYKSEYKKHADEFDDYEQFSECYSMEVITEMHYIAVDDLSTTMKEIALQLHSISKRHALKIVEAYSDVAIHIGDHCYMTIRSRHTEIIAEILRIVESYRNV